MRTRHLQAIKTNQNISLENLASKQRIFQIVKEQHGFMLTVRSKDCSQEPKRPVENNLDIAPVRVPEDFGGLKSWWSQP